MCVCCWLQRRHPTLTVTYLWKSSTTSRELSLRKKLVTLGMSISRRWLLSESWISFHNNHIHGSCCMWFVNKINRSLRSGLLTFHSFINSHINICIPRFIRTIALSLFKDVLSNHHHLPLPQCLWPRCNTCYTNFVHFSFCLCGC